ncbi:MAG TPA: DUF4012 domain-containing protein, partial [Catenuloplanes sp.]
SGVQARDHLQRAAGLVAQLREEVTADPAAAARTLAALQRQTRAARETTDDPLWRLGRGVPLAGDDLAAVQTVAIALDELATDGLPPLVRTAEHLNVAALAPAGGRVNLDGLRRAAPQLVAADAAVRRARDRITAIPVSGLAAPIRSAVVGLRGDLERAARNTATAARTATLLPPLLGADGPRTYLVLFQNPAEVRATGGMPGAYVVIRAKRGAIEVIDQGTAAAELNTFDRPVLRLDPALRSLYTDRPGVYLADVNLSPHFPTAALLAREMYRLRSGRTVDGVLATDPVALSYLLGALGPVPVPGGPALTAENAVRVLLSETYARSKNSVEQDRYFAAAALAAFQAVMHRSADPADLLAQLARAAGERRILFWTADPGAQRTVADTVLGGVLPDADGAGPTVGVFLNDGTGAKLGYYLRQSAAVAVVDRCRADGRRKLTLRVSLGSTAPTSGLPEYVLGMGLAGDPYTIRTNVAVYSPTGGSLVDMRLDGVARPFGAGEERHRAVGIIVVDVKPGTTRILDVTLLTGVPTAGWGPTVTPRLWTTPGVAGWPQSVRSADGCAKKR